MSPEDWDQVCSENFLEWQESKLTLKALKDEAKVMEKGIDGRPIPKSIRHIRIIVLLDLAKFYQVYDDDE